MTVRDNNRLDYRKEENVVNISLIFSFFLSAVILDVVRNNSHFSKENFFTLRKFLSRVFSYYYDIYLSYFFL